MSIWDRNGTASTVSVVRGVKEELQVFTENWRLPEGAYWSNW